MSTIAERAVDVAVLRREGLTYAAIGARLGISPQYVGQLLRDPTGERERARKANYGGVCGSCGARTDGSNGRAKAPKLCAACAAAKQHAGRRWTREAVLAEIRRFYDLNGRKPNSSEWLRGNPHDGSPYVDVSTVQREFGSWNNAIRAAGLPTDKPGKYIRTAETRRRMSEAQRRIRGVSTKYGPLRSTGFVITEAQFQRLAELDGLSRSEHARRALDLYLRGVDRGA